MNGTEEGFIHHVDEDQLLIPPDPVILPPAVCDPRTPPVVAPRPHYEIESINTKVLVVSSFLPGNKPLVSERFPVMGVECQAEFSYWAGLSSQWNSERTLINVEQDMEFSDELVAELADCPHPACAYPYQVYPGALGRYIYCATRTEPTIDSLTGKPSDPVWISPGDEWAVWSSIGFCKLAAEVRVKPLDKLFWQWLEHGVNRVVGKYAEVQWHIHWPEIRHHHDYEAIPDHLW